MRILVAITLALTAAACSQPEEAPGRVVGVIDSIQGDGAISGIAVVEDDGDRYEIAIAGDIEYGFDLEHLREHEATGDPVDVRLEERGDDLVALSIDDA